MEQHQTNAEGSGINCSVPNDSPILFLGDLNADFLVLINLTKATNFGLAYRKHARPHKHPHWFYTGPQQTANTPHNSMSHRDIIHSHQINNPPSLSQTLN